MRRYGGHDEQRAAEGEYGAADEERIAEPIGQSNDGAERERAQEDRYAVEHLLEEEARQRERERDAGEPARERAADELTRAARQGVVGQVAESDDPQPA